jgi:hypothetical protein
VERVSIAKKKVFDGISADSGILLELGAELIISGVWLQHMALQTLRI